MVPASKTRLQAMLRHNHPANSGRWSWGRNEAPKCRPMAHERGWSPGRAFKDGAPNGNPGTNRRNHKLTQPRRPFQRCKGLQKAHAAPCGKPIRLSPDLVQQLDGTHAGAMLSRLSYDQTQSSSSHPYYHGKTASISSIIDQPASKMRV